MAANLDKYTTQELQDAALIVAPCKHADGYIVFCLAMAELDQRMAEPEFNAFCQRVEAAS